MSVAAAQALLAHKSKSFALATKLLAPAARADVAVLYAYCRRADDLVDDAVLEASADNLERLTRELDSIYAGIPQADPLLAQFQALVERRRIPETYPRALLEGLRTDIEPVRVATLEQLLLYAYRVAGVVGVMMCYITGLTHPRALENAVHLGIAMQLTNICRDITDDWERQRLYLPQELLSECGAAGLGSDFSVSLVSYRTQLAAVSKQLLTLADRYYASGHAGLPALPARTAFAVRTASYVYSGIGAELHRRHYDALAGRAFVSSWKKFLFVARALLVEFLVRCALLFSKRSSRQLRLDEPQASGDRLGHTFSLHL